MRAAPDRARFSGCPVTEFASAVAIVTGAAGGIGAALAQRFAERGAKVVLTDINAGLLAATDAELSGNFPGQITSLAGDVSDSDFIRASISHAEDTFDGPVDIYAANAGVGRGRDLEATPADWSVSIDVNLMAHVRAAEILVPGWLERGRGDFLSTASAAGLLTQLGSATYSVTKHAAVGFAEWMKVTYGDRGIGVSCLCPMGVRTAMLDSGVASEDDTDKFSTRAVTAAGAVLEPLEVADVVVTAMQAGEFLVLPHPEVLEFYRRKAADYDRWIRGMQRFRLELG